MDTTTLDNQFVAVDSELPVLLAHSGQISEFIVQGIGPIPDDEKKQTCVIV